MSANLAGSSTAAQLRRPRMQISQAAAALSVVYRRTRSLQVLALITRLEGGQMSSITLRSLLREVHGVDVGAYSYGSLLTPGLADTGTQIGRYVSIGPNVRRFGASHPLNAPSLHPYWYNPTLGLASIEHDVERGRISIEHDSWIGANVTILPNVKRIGVGAVVGAGSVVTRDVEDFSIVVGNPARHARYRLNEDTRRRLLAQEPWNLDPIDARAQFSQIRLDR